MFGKDALLADLQLFKALPRNEEVDELELQVRLCKILGLAFALSVAGSLVSFQDGLMAGSAVNLGGIGPLIALVLVFRVRRVINQYQGRLGGIWLARLCIIVAVIGTLGLPATIGKIFWQGF